MEKDDKIVKILMLVFMIDGIVVTDSILTSLPLPGAIIGGVGVSMLVTVIVVPCAIYLWRQRKD